MKYCGVIGYWCCEHDAKPSGAAPWYERNNFNKIVAGVGGFISVCIFGAILLYGPQMYGLGLLVGKILGMGDDIDYIIGCILGLLGIFMLFVGVVGLGLIVFIILALIAGMTECVNCCDQCCTRYNQIQYTPGQQEMNTISTV